MLVRIVASLDVPPPAGASCSTVRLLTTCLTPSVFRATRSASAFSAAVGTAPLKVTTPFDVSTSILTALVSGSVASLLFTDEVMAESLVERLSQPIKKIAIADTTAINVSFIFPSPSEYWRRRLISDAIPFVLPAYSAFNPHTYKL